MVSVILYGRNDSYGYNLHKRAAISLNCIAECLTMPRDEILFVDYNTPDDYPTFPESIQDTLTARAKEVLKILRVRPNQHARFAEKSHLVALEPVARNVAVRRSNPENRWVLSTNTDMIFCPKTEDSLSEIFAGLEDGYYCCPRFELPGFLWEQLNRSDSTGMIRQVDAWGEAFHLKQIVRAPTPEVRYDAPGDFQLCLRDDLIDISGFNEEMLLGWHVDSNLAKRINLYRGETRSMAHRVDGYHCDHTKHTTTAMHRKGAPENDLSLYFDQVDSPFVEAQKDTWGLAGEEVEVVDLKQATVHRLTATLGNVCGKLEFWDRDVTYNADSYKNSRYDAAHLFPYLADQFANLPGYKIVYCGVNKEVEKAIRSFLLSHESGDASLKVLVPDSEVVAEYAPEEEGTHETDLFVFDFGWAGSDPVPEGLVSRVLTLFRISAIYLLRSGKFRPKIVGINVVGKEWEVVFATFVNVTKSPYGTMIRQGRLVDELPTVEDCPWFRLTKGEPGSFGVQWDEERVPGHVDEFWRGVIEFLVAKIGEGDRALIVPNELISVFPQAYLADEPVLCDKDNPLICYVYSTASNAIRRKVRKMVPIYRNPVFTVSEKGEPFQVKKRLGGRKEVIWHPVFTTPWERSGWSVYFDEFWREAMEFVILNELEGKRFCVSDVVFSQAPIAWTIKECFIDGEAAADGVILFWGEIDQIPQEIMAEVDTESPVFENSVFVAYPLRTEKSA